MHGLPTRQGSDQRVLVVRKDERKIIPSRQVIGMVEPIKEREGRESLVSDIIGRKHLL